MSELSISIIIPIYNVEPYVEACVRSVMRQTYDGTMECIVVDDCGTDNSMAVVESLISEYHGPITFKVLNHTHNRGVSAARNTGVDAATGDYIFFLDSDDEIMVGCIERLAEPLLVEKYDIVVGDIQTVDESNHFIPNLLALKGRGKVCGLDVLQKYLTNAFPATVWNKLYNKKIIKDYHLMFKEKLIHEDLIWGFQFICFSKSIYLCDCVTYVCKGRSGSQTKTTNMKISAYSYAENVWEMGNFVRKENMEYNEYIHEIIQKFFSETIQKCIWNPKVFIYCYRYMRPSIKLSMKELIKVNRNHVRRYLEIPISCCHLLLLRIMNIYYLPHFMV